MTPNTPAGGAVATVESFTQGSYHRNYRLTWHRDDVPAGANLYTQPPATISADAVLALVAKWISDSDRVQKQRKRVSQARGAYCQALLLCADELEALTREATK